MGGEGRWRGGEPELFCAGGSDRAADFVRERRQTGLFFDGDSLHGTAPVVHGQEVLLLAVFARLGLDGLVPALTRSGWRESRWTDRAAVRKRAYRRTALARVSGIEGLKASVGRRAAVEVEGRPNGIAV
ncbi:MAG: hypothetical protein IMX05_02125 [Hydrogenibacillus schlegelii]|nr:hypothetical protein [Hydrogenibacillus schlegelii]